MPDPAVATHQRRARTASLVWPGLFLTALTALGADVLAQAVGPPTPPAPDASGLPGLPSGAAWTALSVALLGVAKIAGETIQWLRERTEKNQVGLAEKATAAAEKATAVVTIERDLARDWGAKLEAENRDLKAQLEGFNEAMDHLIIQVARKTGSDFEIVIPRRPGDSQIGRVVGK